MKNIAVALDLISQSVPLIEYAKNLAKPARAKIWLIHVVSPDPDFVGYGVGPKYIREDRADVIKAEHKQLAKYKTQLIELGLDAEALLIQGTTVNTLLQEIEKLNIDLLVIGKKAHGVIYRAIIGSTLTDVLQKSNIPVLAIPIKDED